MIITSYVLHNEELFYLNLFSILIYTPRSNQERLKYEKARWSNTVLQENLDNWLFPVKISPHWAYKLL